MTNSGRRYSDDIAIKLVTNITVTYVDTVLLKT
jgi:hypothetical protein